MKSRYPWGKWSPDLSEVNEVPKLVTSTNWSVGAGTWAAGGCFFKISSATEPTQCSVLQVLKPYNCSLYHIWFVEYLNICFKPAVCMVYPGLKQYIISDPLYMINLDTLTIRWLRYVNAYQVLFYGFVWPLRPFRIFLTSMCMMDFRVTNGRTDGRTN